MNIDYLLLKITVEVLHWIVRCVIELVNVIKLCDWLIDFEPLAFITYNTTFLFKSLFLPYEDDVD